MSGMVHVRWVDLWMIASTNTGGRMFDVLSPCTTATGAIYLFVRGLKVVNRLYSLHHTAPKIGHATQFFRSQWGWFILLTFVVSWFF